ncbi:hypothetical protein NQ315_012340 [Exocentrus adspersus]|uniref:C2H2-type domain-containing protein n=1 Tax=Exocentrus adspersus TaxID=1586481 RepID=A0AAV8V8Q9_9CUCU|nr:hypothetical protein NQ315_012340 [Exocentrus adspersus]
MLCRTCLGVLDLSSSIPLSKKLPIGKSVKEILLFFIPQMAQSKLVDQFACSLCSQILQTFIKFIEECIVVDNYLKEKQNQNTSKGIAERSTPETHSIVKIRKCVLKNNGKQKELNRTNKLTLSSRFLHMNNFAENSRKKIPSLSRVVDKNKRGILNKSIKKDFLNQKLPVFDQIEPDKIILEPRNKNADSSAEQRSKSDVQYFNNFLERTKTFQGNEKLSKFNRVVSIATTNRNVDILRLFSETTIETLSVQSLEETGRKRILFIGEQFYNLGRIEYKRNKCSNANTVQKKRKEVLLEKFKQCPVCEEKLATEPALRKHFKQVHPGYSPYTCEKCGKKFRMKSTYQKHVNIFQPYKTCNVKKCLVCHKSCSILGSLEMYFTATSSLIRHIIVTYANGGLPMQVTCKITSYTTKSQNQSISAHLVVGRAFVKLPSFLLHVKSHSKDTCYLCDRCSNTYKTKRQLLRHILKVHHERISKCAICQQEFANKKALRAHMKSQHPDTFLYQCHLCGRGFYMAADLSRHLRQHRTQGVHSKSHTFAFNYRYGRGKGESFPCKYCNKIFTKVSMLRLHLLRFHLKNERFRCRFCSLTFGDSSSRTRHEKRHRDPETYELTCIVCWNRFDTKEQLEQHSLKHLGSRRHRCDQCGESFPSRFLIHHHKRDKHYNEDLVKQEQKAMLQEGLDGMLL